MRWRHHLNQNLRKRHDGRPVSIRSRFIQTPLTKNGKNYLRHPPGQTPGHRDNGPTRRRQARAVRDRARVAKREIRLRTRASTPPHKTRPSKSFLPLKTTLSRSVSTEGARDLRGGATAGRIHTTGGVSGIKAKHHQENKFYLLTKVKSSNKQTKNINTSYNKQTTCKTLRRPQNETKAADCGLFKRGKRNGEQDGRR